MWSSHAAVDRSILTSHTVFKYLFVNMFEIWARFIGVLNLNLYKRKYVENHRTRRVVDGYIYTHEIDNRILGFSAFI